MRFFDRSPIVPLAILFMAGIVVGDAISQAQSIGLYLVAAFLLLLLALILRKTHLGYLLAISPLYLGLGFCAYLSEPDLKSKIQSDCGDSLDLNFVIVDSWVNKHSSGLSFTGKTLCGEKLSVYIKDTSKILSYQSVISTRSLPSEIKPPSSPFMFDYKSYWQKKGIYRSLYLEPGSFELVGFVNTRSLRAVFYEIRSHLEDNIEESISDEISEGLAKAILIGIRSEIDKDLRLKFNRAGVAHIFSISGLHVGILLGFLLLLAGTIGSKRARLGIFYPVIVIIIWSYCAVTGLNTSTIRATFMCTVILVGAMVKRRSNLLNSLSFACLILLVVNARQLSEIGFQLSFLAVFGIAIFYNRLKSQVRVDHKLLTPVRDTLLITISCQITIYPVIIYYFGSVSVISIIANLFIIPLSGLVVVSGIIFLIFSLFTIPFIDITIAFIFESLLKILYEISGFMGGFTFSSIDNLSIAIPELVLYLILIPLLPVLLKSRKSSGYYIATLVVIVLFYLGWSYYESNFQQQKIYLFKEDDKILVSSLSGISSVTRELKGFALESQVRSDSARSINVMGALILVLDDVELSRVKTDKLFEKYDAVVDLCSSRVYSLDSMSSASNGRKMKDGIYIHNLNKSFLELHISNHEPGN